MLRAFTAHAEYPVLDNFVYATTSPVYVSLHGGDAALAGGRALFRGVDRPSAGDDRRLSGLELSGEKAGVLQQLKDARAVYAAKELPY